jgi:starvation-inducible DNA-binding protein
MLADSLKILLATEYAFSLKAQLFHWNVEGPDFAQLHEFFGNLYEEVYNNSIDKTAEYIRALGDYALAVMNALPNSLLSKDKQKSRVLVS